MREITLEELLEAGCHFGHQVTRQNPKARDYVFEVIEEKGGEDGTPLSIAGGGRYDYLAKQVGGKKDVPAVGMAIGVDRIVASPWYKKLAPRIMKKPKIYFIQLGSEAKLKSLNVIEILRKATVRKDENDLIYATEEGKYQAVIQEIKERHSNGQPVLVGTISIQKNEHLAELLDREGITPNVLNAKQHEKEASIITQALFSPFQTPKST
jgi:histidyl-tRNA synthetase